MEMVRVAPNWWMFIDMNEFRTIWDLMLGILPAGNPPLVGRVAKGATYHLPRVPWTRSWMAVQEIVRLTDCQESS